MRRPQIDLCIILAVSMTFANLNARRVVIAQTSQGQPDELRRIWDEGLLKKRPQRRTARIANHPYQRVTAPLLLSRGYASDSILGVTVWRLRPSIPSDSREGRDLIHDKASNQQVDLTAERLGSEVFISEGEFVRITIEIPRASYLYVIDREQYADKTFGPATLIFPTRRINLGNNRVLPGQIVQIPNWNDDPPYLTVRRNPDRNNQIAEVLTILVTTTPLDMTVPAGAMRLSSTQVSDWENRWAAPSERLELKGGSGQVRTKAEKAAVEVRQRLRQDEAPPQTIYRVDAKPNMPFMVDVKLTFTSTQTPVN